MVARAILSKSKRLGLGIVVGLTALWVVGVVSATPAGFDWGASAVVGMRHTVCEPAGYL